MRYGKAICRNCPARPSPHGIGGLRLPPHPTTATLYVAQAGPHSLHQDRKGAPISKSRSGRCLGTDEDRGVNSAISRPAHYFKTIAVFISRELCCATNRNLLRVHRILEQNCFSALRQPVPDWSRNDGGATGPNGICGGESMKARTAAKLLVC